jgi:probable HAF family extracellular repeat protein
LITLDVPGSTLSQAFGLNNEGQVVGAFIDSAGKMHGFVFQDGHFVTIDDPNGIGTTTVNGINDFGQIVGFYVDSVWKHRRISRHFRGGGAPPPPPPPPPLAKGVTLRILSSWLRRDYPYVTQSQRYNGFCRKLRVGPKTSKRRPAEFLGHRTSQRRVNPLRTRAT